MKRIYMVLALVGALAFETKAQTIDLEGVIALPTAGDPIGPHQTLDTDKVLCGIIYNGPDDILSSDVVYFMTSMSRPSTTPGSYYLSGVQYSNAITAADSGKAILIFPNANQIGAGHIAPFKLSSDSISIMFDWEQYSLNDSIVAVNPPFVNGKSYGFFFRAVRVALDGGSTYATDPNPSNNRAVQQIVWNSTTAIQEFAKKDKAEISLYPNPAVDAVNFDFNYASPTHATVLVRDISGRLVYSKNYGWTTAGIQHYNIDISKLNAGNYTVELTTDSQSAVSKFSKK